MAASPPSAISTKANPRDRPVSRSITRLALVTVPWALNAWVRSASVVSKERFPTYRFLLTDRPLAGARPDLTRNPQPAKRRCGRRGSKRSPCQPQQGSVGKPSWSGDRLDDLGSCEAVGTQSEEKGKAQNAVSTVKQ